MRRLAVAALGALLLLCSVGTASGSHTPASRYDVVEQALYDRTVAHRGYIASNGNLVHLAQRRAKEIYAEYVRTGRISHRGAFVGISSSFCRYSEIIGYSFIHHWPTSVAWVASAWHTSPLHESVMHSTWSNDRIGVGREGDAYRGRFYVQVYADYCP